MKKEKSLAYAEIMGMKQWSQEKIESGGHFLS